MQNFKIGDKVKYLQKEPFADWPKDKTGTIIDINGGYILVKPYRQNFVMEFYGNEIVKVKKS